MSSSKTHSEASAVLAGRHSQLGVELLAAGDAIASAAAFRDAIAADANHVEAHHGLIRALRDANQLQAAVTAARTLVALTPNDPLAYTSLSIALQQAGHIPEAEAAAGRARILEWKQQLAEPPGTQTQEKHDPFA